MLRRSILVFLSLIFMSNTVISQNDSVSPSTIKTRKIILLGSSAALTAGSLVYLNNAWYSQYNTGKFHFFNDNSEWLQMDKAGHVFTTYQMGRLMMGAFDWAHFNKKQKLFIGGAIGLYYMTAIECFDGFSNGWGFSLGDETANILGAGLVISQEAYWNEQKILIKYSYAQSGLAQYNPELLGKNFYTQILKDYNGQTYWLSANPSSIFKIGDKFPKWLNLAFGYSAYGMLGGHYNNFVVEDEDGNVLNFERQRRFYLSVDLDLTRIKTRSKVLKKVLSAFNMLKFPAPALQFSNKGVRGYFLYY